MTALEKDRSDAVRGQVHAMWAGVAAGWGACADELDAKGALVTDAMLARAALRAGDRVLELACGPGGVGLAAAGVVGPGGEVVLTDVADEMVAIAATRAKARGLSNVRTARRDLEAIDEPDQSFDVALCREGLMFAIDPARATSEIHRVLRPGGRVAVAVWGRRDRNPWLGILFDAVSAELGMPIPPPGVPGPFSLDDPAPLTALFQDAGFVDVHTEEVAVPRSFPSFEEWWGWTSTLAGPLAAILAGLPAEVTAAITTTMSEAVQPFTTAAGIELPGLTLLASGQKN